MDSVADRAAVVELVVFGVSDIVRWNSESEVEKFVETVLDSLRVGERFRRVLV